MSSLWKRWKLGAALALGLLAPALAIAAGSGEEPERGDLYPEVSVAKGDECVRDTAFMRRNHMDLLRHERAEVVREGVRGGDFTLEKCQECHVNRDSSCDSCHRYAAVRPDCWSCHHYPKEGPDSEASPHANEPVAGDLKRALHQWQGGQ